MSKYLVNESTLQDIATSIKAQKEDSSNIKVKNFATEIQNLFADDDEYFKKYLMGTLEGEEVRIPNDIDAIPDRFFCYQTELESVVIPDNIRKLETRCFIGCSKLTSIALGVNIGIIASDAFKDINANAVINCNFPQGSVAGAPWGAPNTVTINYLQSGHIGGGDD